MKIAVTAKGQDLNAPVDPRFGRASFILIINPETKAFQVLDNTSNKEAFKGAGIQAATGISDMGAEVLLTGFCGPNAFKTLNAAGIKVVNDISGTVMNAVESFNAGRFEYAQAANVDGHW